MKKFLLLLILGVAQNSYAMVGGRDSEALQREYETKRHHWEDDCCRNCCAGITYVPFCCLGILICYKCGKQYCALKQMASRLDARHVTVDDVRCCPCGDNGSATSALVGSAGCCSSLCCCMRNSERIADAEVTPMGDMR